MTQTISRDELRAAIEDGRAIVVETLGPQHYEEAHLPGAINIPHTETARVAAELLPDRDALVVTYCSNAACQDSEVAANVLESLGYANVWRYVEGKQDWIAAGLPIAGLQAEATR